MLSNYCTWCGPNVHCGERNLVMSRSPANAAFGGLSHRDLVQAAVLAPSPDNNQPWRFESSEGAIDVCLDRSHSLPSDVNSMYDLMSIGAALENLSIQASQSGLHAEIRLCEGTQLPSVDEQLVHVAFVTVRPGATPDPLHAQLAARCTNRKLFSSRPVESDRLEAVEQALDPFSDVQLDWITDRKTIGKMARVIAQSDRFRFEYEPFHAEIFRQLRFTVDDVERTRDGLDFRTLEMPPGSSVMIRALRSWRCMQWMNRLGLSRLLTLPSWLSVRKCGAIGALSIPDPSPQGFVVAGRAFQRVWLSTEALGLALHPLGSLPIFIAQVRQLDGRNLHAAHQRLSRRLNDWLLELIPGMGQRTLVMLFRVGYASRPAVQSLRRSVDEVL